MAHKLVIIYALSTCPYCHRARDFAEQHQIRHQLINVDLLQGAEKGRVVEEVQALNPRLSFPTIVIGEGASREVIVGMDERTEQALLNA